MLKVATLVFLLLLVSCSITKNTGSTVEAKDAINETNRIVRQAFRDQDVQTILDFHHPEVEKVFAWDNYQRGHQDMEQALSSLFENYEVVFQEKARHLESLKVTGDSAVMIARFALEGIPKKPSVEPFVYSGVTMIVYVRYPHSPTGWVTLREMVVPGQ